MDYLEDFEEYTPESDKKEEEPLDLTDHFSVCTDIVIKFREIDRKNKPFEIYKNINTEDVLKFLNIEYEK